MKDATQAERWLRLGAEQGDMQHQKNLGWMYANGDGVVKDAAEAVRWYRLAAEQGHPDAQNTLGEMYANGNRVPRSLLFLSQFFGFQSDNGVSKDIVMAHMWFNIASAAGHSSAGKNRDMVENDMNREQIAEATRWAQTCMASDYADCN